MRWNMLKKKSILFFMMTLMLVLPWGKSTNAQTVNQHQYIYDNAHLLSEKQAADLQSLSSKLGKERNTAFIIITVNGTEGKTIVKYVEDFYDENAPGYNQPHGNTAILAVDMQNRDVYLAGFKKAEQYLDSGRLDQIRNKITPDLSDGKYPQAFSTFIQTSYDYMGYKPGVNPENILFKWWFQLIVSVIVAGIIVLLMVYRSGGRVTVGAQTYLNNHSSRVLNQYDHFVRETVTRERKPDNNTKSGGGGGITGGGYSHSGSQGKF